MEPEEKRAVALLQQIQALHKDKTARREQKKREAREVHLAKVAKTDALKMDKRKGERRDQLRMASIKSKRASEGEGNGRARKRSKKD